MKRFFYIMMVSFMTLLVVCSSKMSVSYAAEEAGKEETAQKDGEPDAAAKGDEETADEEEKPKFKALAIKIIASSYERENFTRIIFEANAKISVEAAKILNQAGAIQINFDRPAITDMEDVRRSELKNVYDIRIMSPLGEPLSLKAVFPESSHYRFFTVQKRSILDVYTPKDKTELNADIVAQKKLDLEAEWVSLRAKDPEGAGADNSKDKVKSTEASTTRQQKITGKPSEPIQNFENNETFKALDNVAANPALKEHEITISSTEPFGLSVFERSGFLWMIADASDMAIPPALAGPNKDLFGKIERVDIDRGSAFRVKLPDNSFVQPQGGGFIWKIKISGTPFKLPSAAIRKNFNKNDASTLILTLKESKELLKFTDPLIGDDLAIVTVPKASLRLYKAASFVDLDILPSFIGAVLVPKSDGIRIEATQAQIEISKRDGLNIGPSILPYTSATDENTGVVTLEERKTSSIEQGKKSIFEFDEWHKNQELNVYDVLQNRRLAMASATDRQKRKFFMETAEFLISYAMPYEALGYLDLVSEKIETAGLNSKDLPEYRSLHAVALTGARQFDKALDTLDVPVLAEIDEMQLWRSLALLGQNNANEAFDNLPSDMSFLGEYPPVLRNIIMLDLAEMAFASQQIDFLQSITNQLQRQSDTLNQSQKAGLSFYRGVLSKAKGLPGDVKVMLSRAVKSGDLYFGTRAEYELIQELLRNEEITAADAIPRLERLRFAWRGGVLEAQINQALGVAYVNDQQEQKGLNILRAASSLMPNREAREALSSTMIEAFKEIFLDAEKVEALKPLQALAVYNEFKELLPSGNDGDMVIITVVDKLNSVELFSRATELMSKHMRTQLADNKKPAWTLKLAALNLRNRQPQQALDTLSSLPEARFRSAPEISMRYDMIKSRALSSLDRVDEALAILELLPNDNEIVLQLKVDTAWSAARWPVAATALSALLERQEFGQGALAPKQAQMILNAAIAHNLSGNAAALGQIRQRYASLMRSSPLFKSFQVVTRPVRDAVLSDRQTVMSHVFEADMFGDSLKDMSTIDVNEDNG